MYSSITGFFNTKYGIIPMEIIIKRDRTLWGCWANNEIDVNVDTWKDFITKYGFRYYKDKKDLKDSKESDIREIFQPTV